MTRRGGAARCLVEKAPRHNNQQEGVGKGTDLDSLVILNTVCP